MHWAPICGKYLLDGSISGKCGKFNMEKRPFFRAATARLGNTTWAATARLGSKGLK